LVAPVPRWLRLDWFPLPADFVLVAPSAVRRLKRQVGPVFPASREQRPADFASVVELGKRRRRARAGPVVREY
jgi:hypothetical protein